MNDRKRVIADPGSWSPSAQPHTENFAEIDLMLSGRGIRLFPNQTVFCKEGDICVMAPVKYINGVNTVACFGIVLSREE